MAHYQDLKSPIWNRNILFAYKWISRRFDGDDDVFDDDVEINFLTVFSVKKKKFFNFIHLKFSNIFIINCIVVFFTHRWASSPLPPFPKHRGFYHFSKLSSHLHITLTHIHTKPDTQLYYFPIVLLNTYTFPKSIRFQSLFILSATQNSLKKKLPLPAVIEKGSSVKKCPSRYISRTKGSVRDVCR